MNRKLRTLRRKGISEKILQDQRLDDQSIQSEPFVSFKKFFQKTFIQIFFIVASCIIVYLPNVNHKFVYDDPTLFIEWQTPKNFGNFGKFF